MRGKTIEGDGTAIERTTLLCRNIVPLYPSTQVPVSVGPQDEMKIIGQQTIASELFRSPHTSTGQSPRSRRPDERHPLDCCLGSARGQRIHPAMVALFLPSHPFTLCSFPSKVECPHILSTKEAT